MRHFSVIIPARNEMGNPFIKRALAHLGSLNFVELIIVDNNSTDGSVEYFQQFNCKIIPSNSHLRSRRLNQGIGEAQNDWILLHHPRSFIELEGLEFLKNEELPVWGAFTHAFDDDHPLLKFTSWYSNHIRGDRSGIFYLDHCLFFNKSLLSKNDKTPVPEVSIFEDTEFCIKLLKHEKPKRLPFKSTTSSVRFKKNGIVYQSLLNQVLKVGYHLNFSDELMNRIYEKGLSLNSKY